MTDPMLSYAAPPRPRGGAAALLAGFLGWTLDAFDFFLVVLCLKSLAKSFAVTDAKMAAAIGLTLLMRPIGALIFGLLADRYGRRRPLMINVVFYSTMSILSGLSPNYGTFLVCRILFGIGMGGEWGVGASLAMEKVSPRFRGLLSGLLQEGYAVGNLLASAVFFACFDRLRVHLGDNGWRPLFLLGGLPALLAFYVRSHVFESEVWEKSRAGSWSNLGSELSKHWKVFFVITAVMFMMNLTSHGTQDLFPKLLTDPRPDGYGFGRNRMAAINAVGAFGAVVGGVCVGMLSDKLGRRWSMVGSFILATAVVPIWAFAPSVGVLVLGTFLIQFFVQGAWGVIPAYITELSPDSVRGFLPGFGYQCGVAMAGSISLLQATLQARMALASAMAWTAAIVFVAAAVVISLCRERKGFEFGTDPRAVQTGV